MGSFDEDDTLVAAIAAATEQDLTGRLLEASPELQDLVHALGLPPGVCRLVELCLRGDGKLLGFLRAGDAESFLNRAWIVIGFAAFVGGYRASRADLAMRGLELLLPDSFVPWMAKQYKIPADEVRRDLPAAAWSVVHAANESRMQVIHDRAYFAKSVRDSLIAFRKEESRGRHPVVDPATVPEETAQATDPGELMAAYEFARELARSDRELAYLMDLARSGGQHGDASEAARRHGLSESERRALEARAKTRRKNY